MKMKFNFIFKGDVTLKKVVEYKTKQREAILQYLIQNKNKHISVDCIVEHLKQQGESVGKTTVYRYLDVLINKNQVRKYFIEEGASACYQYISEDETEYYHLKCNKCGALLHMDCEGFKNIQKHLLHEHNFELDTSKTVLYGVCKECLGRKEKCKEK